MSDTPRTDAEFKLEAFFDGAGVVETVLVEFAEQLETELADKNKQLAEARAEIERLKCHLEDESMRADGMTTAHAEADARNYRLQELIEQMQEALRAWVRIPDIPLCEAIKTTEAALEAAERVGDVG